ncbi:nitrous oxide reductase family maturation protein NosD [Thermonema rossianum]|uniref:nitrous oxide reductase family maturation protein NosD n=1 Tax=Thermonema rossianum TaxID=55505 RepID=UPI00056EC43B|nr:nitrous oxide reductase family maturation protein NosD [Thermonema rossianum]
MKCNNHRWILFIWTIVCLAAPAKAELIVVCKSCELSSIKEAVAAAQPCDTVLIKKGTYYEHGIVVDKSLYVLGEKGSVIDAQQRGEIILVTADNVWVEGLTLQNVGVSYLQDWAAIRILEAAVCVVKNNHIINPFFGIYLQQARYCTVENNRLQSSAAREMSSGNAIHSWYSEHLRIIHNEVSHFRDGIYLEYTTDSEITHNHAYQNLRYGLHFMFSDNNRYQYNRFSENGAGVAVMFSRNVVMEYNEFIHNWGAASYGLLLKEIYDARIEHNMFQENTTAVHGESATRILFRYNQLNNNGKGFMLMGSCMDNVFEYNVMEGNTFDVVASSELQSNEFRYNYWANYSGYDLDHDGIGDVPYRPVSLYSYIVNQSPTTILLLRSFFVDVLNYTEYLMPFFTPDNVKDNYPLMTPPLNT